MKETKPYWYHNTAHSMEPYFVYLGFSKLCTSGSSPNIAEMCGHYLKGMRKARQALVLGLQDSFGIGQVAL